MINYMYKVYPMRLKISLKIIPHDTFITYVYKMFTLSRFIVFLSYLLRKRWVGVEETGTVLLDESQKWSSNKTLNGGINFCTNYRIIKK